MYQNYPKSANWVPIDEQTITGTTFTSKSWAPGAFRWLRFAARCTASGGTGTITLPGLSGSYDGGQIATIGASAPVTATLTSWAATLSAGFAFEGEIDIRTGGTRQISASYSEPTSTVRGRLTGGHTDTSSDVTGFVMTLGSSGTFTVTLLGMP